MNQFNIFFDSQNKVYQVRTKSDTLIFEFPDSEEEKIFSNILKLYEKYSVISFAIIKKELCHFCHSKVLDVVQELQKCELLNSGNYSDYEQEDTQAADSYNLWKGISVIPCKCKLCFIGHKQLGERLIEKAKFQGYQTVSVIYTPNSNLTEIKIEEIANTYDFVIMDATFWNPYLLSCFNSAMFDKNKPWLYIDGMIDNVNYSVGPIFHGKETGCYECLTSRMASNDFNSSYTEAYRIYLTEKKTFSKNKISSLPIEDIIASIVILDINKYILGLGVPESWKNTLLLNTSNYSITKHYFLKNPLCEHCNPELSYSTSPWLERIILKEK